MIILNIESPNYDWLAGADAYTLVVDLEVVSVHYPIDINGVVTVRYGM